MKKRKTKKDKSTINLYAPLAQLAFRVMIGSLMMYTGAVHLTNLSSFASMLASYSLFNDEKAAYIAMVLAPLCLFAGFMLTAGYRIKAGAAVALGLLVFFAFIITAGNVSGAPGRCDCSNESFFLLEVSFTAPSHTAAMLKNIFTSLALIGIAAGATLYVYRQSVFAYSIDDIGNGKKITGKKTLRLKK